MSKKKTNKIGFKTEYSYTPRVTKTVPKDTYANNKMAIVFFDQDVLNSMKNECLDTAKENEWQIHHADLRVEMERNGITVSLFFPLAFYNFKQEVGPSSVEWETEDADKAFEEVRDAAKDRVTHMINEMPIFKTLEDAGIKISYDFGDFGSIHRHPGRFGFSSIDTRKNPDDPGVIYRRAEAENMWQVDSVMYMSSKQEDVEIYTTECRIIDVKEAADGGIEGTYCKIPTVTFIRDMSLEGGRENDGLAEVFGSIEETIFDKYTIVGHVDKYPLLQTIMSMFREADYQCDTSNVKAERIEPRVYTAYKKDWAKQSYGYGNPYGYNRYSGYHQLDNAPKGRTKIDVRKELVDLCPINISDAEKALLDKTLENVSFLELKELYKIAYSMNEDFVDAEYELLKNDDKKNIPSLFDEDYYDDYYMYGGFHY